jgi:hypothetical protein
VLFNPAVMEAWILRVNADREFQLVSRWTDMHFQLVCGNVTRLFRITPGKLSAASQAATASVDTGAEFISLEGSESAWAAFLKPVPESPNHHILGMDRRRDDFSIAQGRHFFIRHLRVMTIALNLMRDQSTNEVKA